MARVELIGRDRAGFATQTAYWFTRRLLGRMTGCSPERMLEPLEAYARIPRLLRGYARLEQATAGLNGLPRRVRALAELRTATLTACEYCIDLGSQIARRWGLTDEELMALSAYRSSPVFNELDILVLDYATGMSRTPVEVPDELVEALRRHLDDDQIVELTHLIALENLRGRFNRALDIGAAGFSADAVCAVPARPPQERP
jgi:AhpD family alkylhydroperoxidase